MYDKKAVKKYKKHRRELLNKKAIQRYYDKPKQAACQHKVFIEKRARRLKPPKYCNNCKKKKKLECHHPNYNKPLKIIWLCHKCHCQLHFGKVGD